MLGQGNTNKHEASFLDLDFNKKGMETLKLASLMKEIHSVFLLAEYQKYLRTPFLQNPSKRPVLSFFNFLT